MTTWKRPQSLAAARTIIGEGLWAPLAVKMRLVRKPTVPLSLASSLNQVYLKQVFQKDLPLSVASRIRCSCNWLVPKIVGSHANTRAYFQQLTHSDLARLSCQTEARTTKFGLTQNFQFKTDKLNYSPVLLGLTKTFSSTVCLIRFWSESKKWPRVEWVSPIKLFLVENSANTFGSSKLGSSLSVKNNFAAKFQLHLSSLQRNERMKADSGSEPPNCQARSYLFIFLELATQKAQNWPHWNSLQFDSNDMLMRSNVNLVIESPVSWFCTWQFELSDFTIR